VNYRFRLGSVTQLFDLRAPEQSLLAQSGGQQCGDEINGLGTRPRPSPAARRRQLSGISLGDVHLAGDRGNHRRVGTRSWAPMACLGAFEPFIPDGRFGWGWDADAA
jgi:hypothetical protein